MKIVALCEISLPQSDTCAEIPGRGMGPKRRWVMVWRKEKPQRAIGVGAHVTADEIPIHVAHGCPLMLDTAARQHDGGGRCRRQVAVTCSCALVVEDGHAGAKVGG